MLRQQKMILFFGTNGTGKTTKMLQGAISYAKTNSNKNKRVLFVLPDDSERKYDGINEITTESSILNSFEGFAKIIAENRKTFSDLYTTYTAKNSLGFNGLIVFDDIGVILNRRPEEAITMLKRRRQMNADMFFNFHGLTTDMPRAFFSYATDLVLFKTGDDYKDTMLKLPSNKREEFEKMYFRVEKETETNPFYCEQLKLR